MIDAALALWTPCSTKTTPAISGLSRGAKNTNQPWSRRSFPLLAAATRPLFEMTCAVPVLPHTSCPGIFARPPVPPALTTIHMPSRMAWSFSGVTSIFDCGGGSGTRLPAFPVVDGPHEMRRDARAAVGERRRVDGERDRASPRPAPARWRPRSSRRHTISSLRCVAFHCVDGTSPVTSLGRSMFDFTPRPSSVAHLLMLIDAEHVARRYRSTRRTTARWRGAGPPRRVRPSSSTGSSGRRTSHRRRSGP